MFVLKSTYEREVLKRMQVQTEFTFLQDKWNRLVTQVNARGGVSALASGRGLSKEEINKMLILCHPDKHGGKQLATDVTTKLLDMRKLA